MVHFPQGPSLELGTTHLGETSFTQAYRLRGPGGEVWAEAEARQAEQRRRARKTVTTAAVAEELRQFIWASGHAGCA